jgi:hypothetical protein
MAKNAGQGVRPPPPRLLPPNALSAKDAVVAAGKYFKELTGIDSGVTIDEVELEEAKGKKYWMVTLGYLDPTSQLPFSLEKKKNYRVFKVDAITGSVLSMKIRTFD